MINDNIKKKATRNSENNVLDKNSLITTEDRIFNKVHINNSIISLKII